MNYYPSRQDAGMQLAEVLERRRLGGADTVVLALPRGGVVLGAEVARKLRIPLGVMIVKKIGHPLYPEYAIGAMAEDQPPIYNQSEVYSVDEDWLVSIENLAREVIEYRHNFYYGKDFMPPDVIGRTIILVDDGIATGLTMQAAIRALRVRHAKRIIVAVPVASADSVETLQAIADDVIVLMNPDTFTGSVGSHYGQFEQVDDTYVKTTLRKVRNEIKRPISVDITRKT